LAFGAVAYGESEGFSLDSIPHAAALAAAIHHATHASSSMC
jgi:hypothetical protein